MINSYTSMVNFIELQKKSLVKELKYKPAHCLSATTREKLFCHAKDFGWEIKKHQKQILKK